MLLIERESAMKEVVTMEKNTTLELNRLLEEFSPLFSEPQDLPPSHTRDHSIHLLARAQPSNILRYRYPYYQKK